MIKNTIKNKKEIDDLFKTGKKIKIEYLLVIYKKSDKTQFLFTVQNGNKLTAVKRNFIKRKLRIISQKIKTDKTYNIALIGNEKIIDLKDYDKIINKINTEFNKINITLENLL